MFKVEFPDEGQFISGRELPKVALQNPEINDLLKQYSVVSIDRRQDLMLPIPNILFVNLKILKLHSAIHLKDF